EEPGANTTMPKWKLYLPIIVGGSILLLVAFVSISLFVWALPVILPLFLIWMIIRWIQKV
ncbi:MAG: hypothetical protein KAI70_02090, partial [Candidatus Omnitrophica bacterium]|nr:hypothetical protein [Candidatus Omnitrophota bacterium]